MIESNYTKINNNKCINCKDGELISIEDLNRDIKECQNCGLRYLHSDDMGPGSWKTLPAVNPMTTHPIPEEMITKKAKEIK